MRQDLASARRDMSNIKKTKPKRPFGKGLQRERSRKRERERESVFVREKIYTNLQESSERSEQKA